MLENEETHFARDCQIEAQYRDAASLGIKLQLYKKRVNYKALTVSDMCHIILLWLQTNFAMRTNERIVPPCCLNENKSSAISN